MIATLADWPIELLIMCKLEMATDSWFADIRRKTRSEPVTDRIRIPAWLLHGSQIIRSTPEMGELSADIRKYPRILKYPRIVVIIREYHTHYDETGIDQALQSKR